MKLTKPLSYFDVESTGLSIKDDRIIEIAIIKIDPDGSRKTFYSKCNPEGKSISAEATSKHGFTLALLQNEPSFKEIAQEVMDFIEGSDLGGFNCARFDVPILFEELIRAGIRVKASDYRIVDAFRILQKAEPRTLAACYERFTGKNLEGAHQATADIEATIKIMDAIENEMQISASTTELHDFALGTDMIDFSGKLKKNDAGQIIMNFGKYKGQLVKEVFKIDRGYFTWILGTDLTQHTRTIFLTIIQILENN